MGATPPCGNIFTRWGYKNTPFVPHLIVPTGATIRQFVGFNHRPHPRARGKYIYVTCSLLLLTVPAPVGNTPNAAAWSQNRAHNHL